jgi:hypothetical protein
VATDNGWVKLYQSFVAESFGEKLSLAWLMETGTRCLEMG